MTDNNGSQEAVVIERSFDAPVDLIWQMWTDPEHFRAWYGPEGATIPVAKMDVRVGGTRLVCMETDTPDGSTLMWFAGEYREVVENERILELPLQGRQVTDLIVLAGAAGATGVVGRVHQRDEVATGVPAESCGGGDEHLERRVAGPGAHSGE